MQMGKNGLNKHMVAWKVHGQFFKLGNSVVSGVLMEIGFQEFYIIRYKVDVQEGMKSVL